MSDAVFRSFSPSIPTSSDPVSEPTPVTDAPEGDFHDVAPIEVMEKEGKDVLLMALGIDDRINNLPEEDKKYHSDVKKYVNSIIKERGLTPTPSVFKNVLNDLKFDMGLDYEADPSKVIERIGGVIEAWNELSFIRDPREKRQVLMKLGKAESSEEMNRIVFEEMSRRRVWQ